MEPDPLDDPLGANAMILLILFRAGKLNGEILPPEEFQIIQNQPISPWPDSLKEKLRPCLGEEET